MGVVDWHTGEKRQPGINSAGDLFPRARDDLAQVGHQHRVHSGDGGRGFGEGRPFSGGHGDDGKRGMSGISGKSEI